jgi:dTDP-4-amino-4,6-dideoxygalactose transaminase
MELRVPFGAPTIGAEEVEEVTRTLKSGWLVSGPLARQFEEEFRRYVDAAHAVALNSGTAALHLALLAAGIGAGDEVVTSPLTFVATANAIMHTGAEPVFADVDPVSQNLSAERAAERITVRTKAIMPVHLYGRSADLDGLEKLADAHGAALIADAAHAIETRHSGRSVGVRGLAAAYSFQATKNVTTGEGGMVVTHDEELAWKVRLLRSHGLDRDAWGRFRGSKDGDYDLVLPGFKLSLPDLAAAIGVHQLRRVEANLSVRERYAARYDEAFGALPELELPAAEPTAAGHRHARHLYTFGLRLEQLTVDRDEFVKRLIARGIGCGVHYRAVHLSRFYRERFGFARGDFPVAEHIADRTVSVPFSPGLTPRQVDDVIAGVTAVLAEVRS